MNINLSSGENIIQQYTQMNTSETAEFGKVTKPSYLNDLVPGQLFEGKVKDITNDMVKILLSDDTTLNATMQESVNLNIGDSVVFRVKENSGSKVVITPYKADSESPVVMKALEGSGLKVNEKNISVVKGLMEQGQPLDKKTILDTVRMVNRYPETNISDIVTLNKHGIPVNQDNINMFQTYSKGNGMIMDMMENISDDLPELLESIVSESSESESVDFFSKIIDSIIPEENSMGRENVSIEKDSIAEGRILPEKNSMVSENVTSEKGSVSGEKQVSERVNIVRENVTSEKGSVFGEKQVTERGNIVRENLVTERDNIVRENVATGKNSIAGEKQVPDRGNTSEERGNITKENITKENITSEKRDVVSEKTVPEKENVVSEKTVPEKGNAVSEKTVPEKKNAVSERPVPEKENAVSEKAVPEKENAVSEKTVPEKENAVLEKAVPGKDDTVSEKTVPGKGNVFSEKAVYEEKGNVFSEKPVSEKGGVIPEKVVTEKGYAVTAKPLYEKISSDSEKAVSEKGSLASEKAVPEKGDAVLRKAVPEKNGAASEKMIADSPQDMARRLKELLNKNNTKTEQRDTVQQNVKSESNGNELENAKKQLNRISHELTKKDDINLKNVKEEIVKIFEKLDKEEKKEFVSGEELKTVIKNIVKKGSYIVPEKLILSENPKEEILKTYDKINEKLEKLNSIIKNAVENGNADSKDIPNVLTSVKNAGQNLNFMNDLNQLASYVQIPVKFSNQETEGELYVLNKNKQKTAADGLKAYLHFDLENLGATNIRLSLKNKSLKMSFELDTKESAELVEQHIGELVEKLENKGFIVNSSVEEVSREEFNAMDDIFSNDTRSVSIKRYAFDMRT